MHERPHLSSFEHTSRLGVGVRVDTVPLCANLPQCLHPEIEVPPCECRKGNGIVVGGQCWLKRLNKKRFGGCLLALPLASLAKSVSCFVSLCFHGRFVHHDTSSYFLDI